MPSKKTLVLGASSNPEQYSNMAIVRLRSHGHAVEAIGKTAFQIKDVHIGTEKIDFPDIHTVTLYLNPTRQTEYVEYIFSLNPTRIIFNPGTENENLKKLAENQGIEAINACTLVLLSTGAY
jgi:predicted CoA-binding protein